MKKPFLCIYLLLSLLFVSCSQLLEVVQEPEEQIEQTEVGPVTKAFIEPPKLSKEEMLGYIQSNHITMLVNGVDFIDSLYVQTLTEQDMKDLKITEIERSFSDAYVNAMNEGLKKHKK